MQAQVLDSMDLERERGITIKAQSVTLQLPGARRPALSAQSDRHPGARGLLLRGVAQPGRLRRRAAGGRRLPGRRGAERRQLLYRHRAGARGAAGDQQDRSAFGRPRARRSIEIEEIIGIEATDAVLRQRQDRRGRAGAARGDHPPHSAAARRSADAPLQALIIDSWFDNYVGVVSLVRVVNGTLRRGDKIRVMSTGRSHYIDKLGRFTPKSMALESLSAGEVGFVIAGIKRDRRRPGRRHHHAREPSLRRAAAGLQADPAARVRRACSRSTPRTTRAFATRWPSSSSTTRRCTTSRRCRPPWASASAAGSSGCCTWTSCRSGSSASTRWNLITSAPTVVYEVARTDGSVEYVDNPSKLPAVNEIAEIREPIITASILVPPDYVGAVLGLCSEKRGVQKKMQYLGSAGVAAVRAAAGRGGAGFLRPAQIRQPRLCVVRLRIQPFPGRRRW